MNIKVNEMRDICTRVFENVGVPKEDAERIATAAVTSDERGFASHGTIRLNVYRKRILKGLINPKANVRIVNDSPTLVHLDGDNGLGQVVCYKGADIAIERAKKYGSCVVSIFNTNHAAYLTAYAMKIAEAGMIAYLMCNTKPFVAAIGSTEPVVGTNPMCWALPAKPFPIILDMAISPARGKVKNCAKFGKPIPEGWALGPDGLPTTDPNEALKGVLLPIAGHKGYGMGLMVEAMSAIMSGAIYGKNVTHNLDDYEHIPNCGVFIMAIDPSQLMPAEEFDARMEDYKRMIKESKKAPGAEILLPGELEYRNQLQNAENGLTLDDGVVAELKQFAEETL